MHWSALVTVCLISLDVASQRWDNLQIILVGIATHVLLVWAKTPLTPTAAVFALKTSMQEPSKFFNFSVNVVDLHFSEFMLLLSQFC